MSNNFNLIYIELYNNIENYTTEKNIYQTTFYFVEQGPGCGSEDIKKEM